MFAVDCCCGTKLQTHADPSQCLSARTCTSARNVRAFKGGFGALTKICSTYLTWQATKGGPPLLRPLFALTNLVAVRVRLRVGTALDEGRRQYRQQPALPPLITTRAFGPRQPNGNKEIRNGRLARKIHRLYPGDGCCARRWLACHLPSLDLLRSICIRLYLLTLCHVTHKYM